jgi:hypothetical protein
MEILKELESYTDSIPAGTPLRAKFDRITEGIRSLVEKNNEKSKSSSSTEKKSLEPRA